MVSKGLQKAVGSPPTSANQGMFRWWHKGCHGEHTPHGDRVRELSSRALGDMLSEQAPAEGAPTRRRSSGSKKDTAEDSPGAGLHVKRADIVNFLHLALDFRAG